MRNIFKTAYSILHRLSLNGKIVIVVIVCVLSAFAVLTVLIIRREISILETSVRKNAEVIVTTISAALRDNMIGGRTDDTVRLIGELSSVPGVLDLTVIATNGNRAFGLPGSAPELDDGVIWSIQNGFESVFSVPDGLVLVKPLMNESRCRSCHPGTDAIRGAVIVKLSTEERDKAVMELIKRMTGFGTVAAVFLSILLIVFGKRMIVSPLRNLTYAARRISNGEYVLLNSRSIRCRDILSCDKTECSSYYDTSIPCWLKSGTLCNGEPVGHFALKLGNCMKCRVYKELRGDEIKQLKDDFNRMSLTLREKEEELKRRLSEVDGLNQELKKNNTKLTTLLDASKLMTSTLELDRILTDSMRIILNATNLKMGVILLLEYDIQTYCWEFFDCKAFNCPAYKTLLNCWHLSGTMCHGDSTSCPHGASGEECWRDRRIHTHFIPLRDYNAKVKACSSCDFFANIVLIPKITVGFQNGSRLGKKIKFDGSTVHRAMVIGKAIVDYSGMNPFDLPIETATEIALPLKIKEQMIGILYLASNEKLRYDHQHIEFFQLLAEVVSSGIFNSRLYDDMEQSYLQTVGAMANAVEAKDPYTRGHSERVAKLSAAMADVLGLSKQEKEHLQFAALLHDVGKIGIDRHIIRKKEHLNKSEEQEMRSHPEHGVRILSPIHFLKPTLAAILHHHENFDGTGYPAGLKGGEIPFKARILCVADAWDAMRSDRPYRKALSIEKAKEEMLRCAGIQFDPEVVAALIRCVSDDENTIKTSLAAKRDIQ